MVAVEDFACSGEFGCDLAGTAPPRWPSSLLHNGGKTIAYSEAIELRCLSRNHESDKLEKVHLARTSHEAVA
jgi:hypothetical protein